MSSKGIEISPKYGMNTSLVCCFFCREPKEMAFMGRIRERHSNGRAVRGSDVEAPKEIVADYEPCEKCKEKIDKGFIIFRGTENKHNTFLPEIAPGIIANNAVVIKAEAASSFIDNTFNVPEEQKKIMLEKKAVVIEDLAFDSIFSETK